MVAVAEGDVPVRLAVEHARVRVGELAGVAVGGGVGEGDDLALLDVLAVQLHVLGRVAAEHLDRGEEAQELVDRARDQRRLGEQPRADARLLGEELGRHRHRARRRLVARHQHHDPEAADLEVGEPVALDLGLEQQADEVVAAVLLALCDEVVEVLLELLARPLLPLGVLDRALEHAPHPVGPLRLVLDGEAHEHAERAERHRRRELAHEVAVPAPHDRGEQGRRQPVQVGPEGVDAALREDAVDDAAVERVLGRVELDRQLRVVAGLARRDHRRADHARGEAAPVDRGLGHVFVAGEHPEAAVAVGVDDRVALADLGEHGVGVVDERRIVVVEARLHGAVGHRRPSSSRIPLLTHRAVGGACGPARGHDKAR